MRLNIKNLTGTLLLIGVVAFFSACQKKSTLPNFGQISPPNQFEEPLQNQFPGPSNPNGNTGPDLLGGGGLNNDLNTPTNFGDLGAAEQQGLGNLLADLEGSNPQNEADLPPELLQELQDALNNGNVADPQVAFQKIALAGKVLTSCLASVEDYVPRPGEPLQGDYTGSCGGKKMPLTITGVYQKIFRRRPSSSNSQANNQGNFGGQSPSDTQNHGFANGLGLGNVKFRVKLESTNGIMNMDKAQNTGGSANVLQSGIGTITVGKYTGKATDIPSNGKPAPRAELTRPDEGSGKHLVKGCTGTWLMKLSRNPIPEKYVEAMKKVGQCYRKALILFSPGFDRMFRNMSPELRQVVQLQLLGIQ